MASASQPSGTAHAGGSVVSQLAAEAREDEVPGLQPVVGRDAAQRELESGIDLSLEKGHVKRMAATVVSAPPSPPPPPPPPPLPASQLGTVSAVLGSLQVGGAEADPHAQRQAVLMQDIRKQRESGESRDFVEPPTNSRSALLREITQQQKAMKRKVVEPTANNRGAMLIEMQKAARARSPWLAAELDRREQSFDSLRIKFNSADGGAGSALERDASSAMADQSLTPQQNFKLEPEPEPQPQPDPESELQLDQEWPRVFVARFDNEGQLGLNYGSRWPYVHGIKPGSPAAQIPQLEEGCKLLSINGRNVDGKSLADTKAMLKARPVELTFQRPRKVANNDGKAQDLNPTRLHDHKTSDGKGSRSHSGAKRITQAAAMAAERAAAEEAHIRQAGLFRARPVPTAVHSPRVNSSPRAAAAAQNFVQRQQAAVSERERVPPSRSLFARSRQKRGHGKQRQANAALIHPVTANSATDNYTSAHERTRAVDTKSDIALHLSSDDRRRRTNSAILHSLQQAMRTQNRSVFGHTIEDPAHVFSAFDRDGSGKLSSDELKNALRRLGLGLTEQQLSDLAKGIDADGDGEIDYAELLDFLVSERSATLAESTEMMHPKTSADDSDAHEEVARTERLSDKVEAEAPFAMSTVIIHPDTSADDPDDGEFTRTGQQSETMEEKEQHYKAMLAAQKKQVEATAQALAAEQAARRAAEAEALQAEQAANAKLNALLVADMKAALENALKAELVARQGQNTDSAIEQYVASLAASQTLAVRGSTDEHLRHNAATQIQAFYRGRRAREEVYRFLIEREERRKQNWEEQWMKAQQMRRRAEQLFQEGEQKLKQARKFAASAEQDRVASTNDDASLQKWYASRSRPESSTQRNKSGVSYLHASYDDSATSAGAVDSHTSSKKTKAAASSSSLTRLSQTHLKKAENIQKAKVERDKRRAQEEAEQCIDWKLVQLFKSVDSSNSGTLQMTGIGILCTQLGLTMDEASLSRAMAKMDGDKDGHVSLLEFSQWFTKVAKARARRSDTGRPRTAATAGSSRLAQHPTQTIQSAGAKLPVGDRLHAWGEKRRDDRIAKQSSWMEDGARGQFRQPRINPKSRKLAEPRTREKILDRFDTWQKNKEEKIAQRVKQQEDDEVKDLQDKPDISVGLSKSMQLQRTGNVVDRLLKDDPKQSSNATAVDEFDVYWAKTETAPKVEHRFASTVPNKMVADPTRPTRSSDARKAMHTNSRASADDATFGEVFLQHSIDVRRQSPSPPRNDASCAAISHTPTPTRSQHYSTRGVGERLHQPKKLPEPEKLSFEPELMFEGRSIPRELAHVADRQGPVHERLLNAGAKLSNSMQQSSETEHKSPRRSSPLSRRAVPVAASAPTWSHIMKMQTVPVDGGRKPREPRTSTEKKKQKVNKNTSRGSPSKERSAMLSVKTTDVSRGNVFNPTHTENGTPTPVHPLVASVSPLTRPATKQDAVVAHAQSSLARAKAEEQAAAREVVSALKTAAACQAAEVEARVHEIQTMQQLELERTGKAPAVPDGWISSNEEEETSNGYEADKQPLDQRGENAALLQSTEFENQPEPEPEPSVIAESVQRLDHTVAQQQQNDGNEEEEEEEEEEEARSPSLFHVAAEKALQDAIATDSSDDDEDLDKQLGQHAHPRVVKATPMRSTPSSDEVSQVSQNTELLPQTPGHISVDSAVATVGSERDNEARDIETISAASVLGKISEDAHDQARVLNPLGRGSSEEDLDDDDEHDEEQKEQQEQVRQEESTTETVDGDDLDPFAQLQNAIAGDAPSNTDSDDDSSQEQSGEESPSDDTFGALEAMIG